LRGGPREALIESFEGALSVCCANQSKPKNSSRFGFNKTAVYEGDIAEADRERRRWATAISNVALPPIIAVLTFLVINLAVSSGLSFAVLTLLTTLFAAVVPFGIFAVLVRRTRADEIDVAARKERGRWLLVSTVSFFIGATVLLLIRAPRLVTVVTFGYGAVTLVILLINLRWKISAHTMGIAVPTTVFLFVFGPWGLFCGLILPPVIWSRVYLKKHTIAQALAGALVGVVLTALVLWLLIPYSPLYAPR
jgi:membrane-associated phospholipid phosphatase